MYFVGYGFHEGPIVSLQLNSENLILTGSEDNTAKLCNLSGKILGTFQNHESTIETVGFCPMFTIISPLYINYLFL